MNPVAHAARGLVSPAAVPAKKKKIALGIAVIADAIQLGLFPIFVEGALSIPDDALDAVVAVSILLILGFRARLALAILAELVPGFALFPSWTLAVMSLPTIPEAPPAPSAEGAIGGAPGRPEKVTLEVTESKRSGQ